MKILRSFIKGKSSTHAAHPPEFIDFLHLRTKVQTQVQNESVANDAKQAFCFVFFILEHTCPSTGGFDHMMLLRLLWKWTFSLSLCAGWLERAEQSVRCDMQLKKQSSQQEWKEGCRKQRWRCAVQRRRQICRAPLWDDRTGSASGGRRRCSRRMLKLEVAARRSKRRAKWIFMDIVNWICGIFLGCKNISVSSEKRCRMEDAILVWLGCVVVV